MSAFRFPSRLYPILDTLGDPDRSLLTMAEAVLHAGIRFLQLRMKATPTRRFVEMARAIQTRAEACSAALVINDRTDIAVLVGAAGVHLGQEDLPALDARRLLGPGKLIGVSTHSVEQALAAGRERVADYIGFGPIFATTSKRDPDPLQGLSGLREVRQRVSLPIAAIGGITVDTAADTVAAGADAVAVIRDLVGAPDVGARVEEFLSRLPRVPG